jgi:hypothetical protein
MRRPLSIAVLLAFAMLPLAALGQRSMGFRGSPAPRARVSSGFAARPAPVQRFAPAPTFAPRSTLAPRIASPSSRVFISHRTFLPNTRFGFRRFHHRRPFFFAGSCFNGFFDPFLCRNPFIGSSFGFPISTFYDPFFSDFSYPAVPPPQQVVTEDNGNSRELALEVQELSDEIQAMRDEERARNESRNTSASNSTAQDKETIFVFRDGHQISVKNYAITGGTVWVLDERAAHKYAISDLDPAATEQANAKNGVDFHLPGFPQNH